MKPRTITINAVLNGYHVTVGCQPLVFNERKTLLKELDAYLVDPAKMELRYRKTALHAKAMVGPEAAAPIKYQGYAIISNGTATGQSNLTKANTTN